MSNSEQKLEGIDEIVLSIGNQSIIILYLSADQTSPSAYLSRSLNLGMGGGTNMGRPAVLGECFNNLIFSEKM